MVTESNAGSGDWAWSVRLARTARTAMRVALGILSIQSYRRLKPACKLKLAPHGRSLFPAPGFEDTVFGGAGYGWLGGSDQFAVGQDADGALDCAFGEAGHFCHALVAEGGGFLGATFGLAPDVEIYKEGGGGFVMADEVAHEDVEDVFVEFGHEGQYTWLSFS